MPEPDPKALLARPRLVPLPEVADPATFVGSCDWGGCDGEPWGMRWDQAVGCYLTVCESCSRTTWTAGQVRRG